MLGFGNIELNIMDPYISGIVRWLNALGIETIRSCDGHGKKSPNIILKDPSEETKVSDLIQQASRGQMILRNTNLIQINDTDRRGIQLPKPARLLRLAENLHLQWLGQADSISE